MDFTTILFYLFSGLVVIASVCVISSRNPVHSVLWLIFAFFNAAGLFILLGAEMLAMLLVIVYVGAVAVLFLFVVMMLNIKTEKVKSGFKSYLPVGLVFAGILFVELTLIITNPANKLELKNGQATPVNSIAAGKDAAQIDAAANATNQSSEDQATENTEAVTKDFKENLAKENAHDENQDTTSLSSPETGKNTVQKSAGITNAQAIGRVLYTDYILYFQSCGLLLLVAMIGAIVLTLRHRTDVRRQNIHRQEMRKKADTITIVNVETGQG